jgi:uncharacterized protein YsxB (DUF464 family)
MTSITVFRDLNHQIRGFHCIGHAGYADAGEDIVCAGISTLVINTINTFDQYTDEALEVTSDQETGGISVQFTKPLGHDGVLLMNSMILGLQGIQDTYGNDFIDLNFREV